MLGCIEAKTSIRACDYYGLPGEVCGWHGRSVENLADVHVEDVIERCHGRRAECATADKLHAGKREGNAGHIDLGFRRA